MIFSVLLLRNRILILVKPENDVLDKIWILLSFRSTNLVVVGILCLGTSTKSEPGRQNDFEPLQSIVGMAAEGWTVVCVAAEPLRHLLKSNQSAVDLACPQGEVSTKRQPIIWPKCVENYMEMKKI